MNSEQRKLIENNPISIATTDSLTPNISVAAYARIVDYNIVITDNYMIKTIENLVKNSAVCIVAYDANWKGVKIIGHAKYATSGKYYDFAKRMPENDSEPVKGVIIVKIDMVYSIG